VLLPPPPRRHFFIISRARWKQNAINTCNIITPGAGDALRLRQPPLMPGRDGNWEPVKGKRHRHDKPAVNNTQPSFEELWKAVEALPKKRWTILKREFERAQSISNARIRNADANQAEQLEEAEREAWNQFGELCQKYGVPLEPRLIVILNRLH
jgi:hypothetical protein